MPTVAKGQVDLEVNKDQVTKDVAGLGTSLGGAFGKVGQIAGGLMGGGLAAGLGKVTNAFPGGALGGVAAGVTVGAVAIGATLFNLGKDFDAAYKSIQKQTGATGDEFVKLKDSFKAVASSTGASFGDIATAVGTVSQRTGATGKELDTLSLSMLRMASITGKDLGSVLESTTKLFNNFQIPVAQMPAAMDKLYVASAKSGVGVDKLSSSAQQFGPVLRQLGYGFDDSIALLASFDKAGVNTGKVTAGMGVALGNLAKTGATDLPAAFAKTVDSINAAGTQAEANSIAVQLFGTRAGPQMAEAIRSGAFSVGELTAELGDAEGALGKTTAETVTFAGKMAKFKNQMAVAFEPAVMGLFTSITDALMGVTPMLTTFAGVMGSLVGVVSSNKAVLIGFAAVLGTFVTAVVAAKVVMMVYHGVLLVVRTAQLAFAAATNVAKVAMIAFNLVMAVNPFVLILVGIVALVAGFVLLYTKVDWFRNAVNAAFGAIVAVAQGAFNWIKSNWPLLLGILAGPIGVAVVLIVKYWDQIKGAFVAVFDWVKTNWPTLVAILLVLLGPIGAIAAAVFVFRDQIIGALGTVVSFFAALPGRVVGALGGLAGSLAGAASSAMSAFGSALSGGIGSAVSAVERDPGQIVGALGNLGRLLFDAGANVINGLVDGIKSKVGAVTGAIGDVAGKIRGALPFSPAKWGPLSGRGNPLYSGRAIGNLVAAGMHDAAGVVAAASAEMAAAAAVTPAGAYDLSGVARGMAAVAPGGLGAPAGGGGPALVIEHAEFVDHADIETLMRQTEFAVTAGRL